MAYAFVSVTPQGGKDGQTHGILTKDNNYVRIPTSKVFYRLSESSKYPRVPITSTFATKFNTRIPQGL